MDRRTFFVTSMGSAAAAVGGVRLFGQNAPSNRVRVAVMGCHPKGRGFSLMKNVMQVPGVEIAAVCDVDSRAREEAAAYVARTAGNTAKQEKDLRKVVEDKNVDGVICAAPDHWHAPAAAMTMKAGKAIYVEKPCSHNPREGEILVDLAAKHSSVFVMGNQRRSSTSYKSAIQEIRSGSIGEPRFARCWYGDQRAPIGRGAKAPVPEWLDWDLWQGPAPRREYRDNVVHYNWHWFKIWGTGECGNNATHFVDVARWALQVNHPSRVVCAGGRYFHEGDDWEWFDTQCVSFEFPGRKMMTWEGLSSVAAKANGQYATGCQVYGLKGSVLFGPDNVCALFDPKNNKLKEWSGRGPAADYQSKTSPTGALDIQHLGGWITCIREKRTDTASPAPEAHASTLLTHLANIALETGESVRVDPRTGKLVAGSPGTKYWAREYQKGWEM